MTTSSWRRARTCCAVVVLVAAAVAPVFAGDDATGGEFGVIGGFTLPDEHLTGRLDESTRTEFSLGLRGGAVFSSHWGWFIDALYTEPNGAPELGDIEMITWRTGLDYLFNSDRDSRWFIDFGGGVNDFDYDAGGDFTQEFVSVGFGKRILLNDLARFRWEIRGDQSLSDDGPFDEAITQLHGLVGFTWGPRGSSVDTDGDGVIDRKDKCPGTPRGATVDEKGCPKDSDGDGVFDGIDKCPDTPKGWAVDEKGCPKDSDGDGVPDGKDKCPDTPKGATVDADGCPKDSDGDGVFDGIDKCPNTPKGAKVDATGCPVDSDGDGVPDGIDKCPNTPKGAKVDATGCPIDSDGDGVFDGIDKCPDTPKGVKVDATGCPEKKLFEEGQRTLVLEGVNFELNKATLTPASRAILDRVAASLKEWPSVKVEVAGHTDSTGSDTYNQKLSQSRAESVRDYLVGQGLPAAQLTATGYGESKPIADNDTNAGRAKNRRVELNRLD